MLFPMLQCWNFPPSFKKGDIFSASKEWEVHYSLIILVSVAISVFQPLFAHLSCTFGHYKRCTEMVPP